MILIGPICRFKVRSGHALVTREALLFAICATGPAYVGNTLSVAIALLPDHTSSGIVPRWR